MSISADIQISEAQLERLFVLSCSQRLGLTPIHTQVRLASGVLDVFCRRSRGVYYVVELKVEPLQPKHLAQVMGYVCELRSLFPDRTIRPLLIGPSLNESHLTNCLSWFEENPDPVDERAPISSACEYRLYRFDALSGIDYRGYCLRQRNAESRLSENAMERVDQLIRAERGEALGKTERSFVAWRDGE